MPSLFYIRENFMRRHFLPVLFITAVFMSVSCSIGKDKNIQSAPFFYVSTPNSIKISGCIISSELYSPSPETGVLTVTFTVKNRNLRTVFINPSLFSLKTNFGLESQGIIQQSDISEIKPFSTVTFTVLFTPINNPALYQQTALCGDFSARYTLSPSFLYFSENRQIKTDAVFAFAADDKAYSDYIEKFGINRKITLFKNTTDIQNFISRETSYAQKNSIASEHSHEQQNVQLFIKMYGNEIYVDKLLCSFEPYTIGKETYVYVKIINRMEEPVKYDAEKVLFFCNGKNYKALYNFAESGRQSNPLNQKNKSSLLILAQNERAYFTVHFSADAVPSEISILPGNGIRMWNDTPVFCTTFTYRPE